MYIFFDDDIKIGRIADVANGGGTIKSYINWMQPKLESSRYNWIATNPKAFI